MKDFQILRYLSKGRWLILIVSLIGAVSVYFYASGNQQYTATTAIRYANSTISSGQAPDGSNLDVSEIYSSTVIKGAIEDLGLDCSVESIRSKVKVEPIISDDEKLKKETALDKGEEYNYFPTDYKITFTADSSKSKAYANDVLDVILKNYYRFYSEKYADQIILPNNSASVVTNDYDYIESAEIIQKSVKDIDDYLLKKAEMYPDFRSSVTGYTFLDLANIYNFINDTEVPALYASILEGKYTKDNELLLKKQQDKIDKNNLNITNLNNKSEKLLNLINNYSHKGINNTEDALQDPTNESDGSQILSDVEGHENAALNVKTTYDDLLNEYVLINQEIKYNEIDRDHENYIKSIYTKNTKNSVINNGIDSQIKNMVNKLNGHYETVYATATEFNEYIGASYLKPLNSLTTSEKVNIKLYIVLAFALFLVVGCLGSIVIGRIADFIDFILYTDKKTKLPNRQMCDKYINKLSQNPLDDDFSFVLVLITSLKDVNQRLGYEVGDSMLAEFGKMFKDSSKNYGFAGYNGANQFMALLENCNEDKCESFIKRIENGIAKYNDVNVDSPIEYEIKHLNSKKDGIYDLRDLISKAFKDIM